MTYSEKYWLAALIVVSVYLPHSEGWAAMLFLLAQIICAVMFVISGKKAEG